MDARLRTTQPVIAPHEWKSGAIPWLIDVVMPFSVGANVAERENLLAEACKQVGGAKPVHGWVEDWVSGGRSEGGRGNVRGGQGGQVAAVGNARGGRA